MSEVKADTLSNRAGSKSVPVGTVVDGSAKAWVNFDGTGVVAIRDSFNVSSITDNGVGDYTVNFTNSLANANYCVSATPGGSAGNYVIREHADAAASTVDAVRVRVNNWTPDVTDVAAVHVIIFAKN